MLLKQLTLSHLCPLQEAAAAKTRRVGRAGQTNSVRPKKQVGGGEEERAREVGRGRGMGWPNAVNAIKAGYAAEDGTSRS